MAKRGTELPHRQYQFLQRMAEHGGRWDAAKGSWRFYSMSEDRRYLARMERAGVVAPRRRETTMGDREEWYEVTPLGAWLLEHGRTLPTDEIIWEKGQQLGHHNKGILAFLTGAVPDAPDPGEKNTAEWWFRAGWNSARKAMETADAG